MVGDNFQQKKEKILAWCKEDVFKQERSHPDLGKNSFKQAEEDNFQQKKEKILAWCKEDVFKQERSHPDLGKNSFKQAEEDNFQQKKEKILAWFEQSGLGPGDPKLSIMLQTTLLIEQSLRNSSNIENSLFHENNKILEEPLSQLSENTLEQVKEKIDNLATFKKPSIKFSK